MSHSARQARFVSARALSTTVRASCASPCIYVKVFFNNIKLIIDIATITIIFAMPLSLKNKSGNAPTKSPIVVTPNATPGLFFMILR